MTAREASVRLFSSIALTVLLALGSQDVFAQAKKKSAKAKAKTTTSKPAPEASATSPAVTETTPGSEATTPETSTTVPATTEFSNPAAVETSPVAPVANEPSSMKGGSHLLGLHAALGLPHPLRAGLVYVHHSHIFSVEANYGAFSVDASGVTAKMNNMELGLRWHPFMGSFYVGALVGNRKLDLEKKEVISGQDIAMKAEVKSNYIAPNVGWMWGADDGGFFASMDLGLLSPSGVTTTFSSNADAAVQTTPEYVQLDKDVRDAGNKLGEISLPMWTLVKLGWLF